MPLSGLSVGIIGLRETIAELNIAVSAMATKGAAGLVVGAKVVQEIARRNLAPHHYRGTAERQVDVSAPVLSPTLVTVTVGHHYPPFNPEGYTFEYGWHSQAGRTPPPGALEEWVVRRGIAPPARARNAAFVIARNIAQRGYSFGELHWLDDAAVEGGGAVLGAVTAAVRL